MTGHVSKTNNILITQTSKKYSPLMHNNPHQLSGISTSISSPIKINRIHPPRVTRIIDVDIDLEFLFQPRIVGKVRASHLHDFVDFVEVGSGRVGVAGAAVAGCRAYGL
jgi:hypothetical protein